MQRNLSIDLVKIIAMFMVLALHMVLCKDVYPQSIIKSWNCGIANVAIPLFFMVSGFLMSNKPLDVNYSLVKIKKILFFVFKTTTLFIVLEWLFFSDGHLLQLMRSYYTWIMQRGIMWQYWYFAAMIILYALLPYIGRVFGTKYHLPIIIILVVICSIIFFLNIFYEFEQKYVRQSFRIWYWLLYFLMGAYISNHQNLFKKIGWRHVLAIFVFMLIYVYIVEIPYDEYSFGSIVCIVYAVIVFSACLSTTIKNERIIKELSSLFLPVYSIHPYVISKMRLFEPYLDYSPFVQYVVGMILVVGINISLAFILMRIPYVKDIFKM